MQNFFKVLAALGRLIFIFAPVLGGAVLGCLPVDLWGAFAPWVLRVLAVAGAWFLWLLAVAVVGTLVEAWRRRKSIDEDEEN